MRPGEEGGIPPHSVARVTAITLDEADIHLWLCHQRDGVDACLRRRYLALLAAEERARYDSITRDAVRRCFLLSRALLRTTLSHYAPVAPADWEFCTNAHGKPEILSPALPLRFNLSHGGDYAVCAVTLNARLGVDIEAAHRQTRAQAIAKHYFSKAEYDDLLRQPHARQGERFFDYWTLKEAYVKALGTGLATSLKSFGFELRKEKPIAVRFFDKALGEPDKWWFALYRTPADHRLALAWERCPTPPPVVRAFRTVPLEGCRPLSLVPALG